MQVLLLLMIFKQTFSLENVVIDKFNLWLDQYKFDITNQTIYNKIFSNWIENDLFINNINSYNLSYKLAHNYFSGYSFSEFREIMNFDNNKKIYKPNYNINSVSNIMVPESIDWRTKNVVNQIKDQGQCGSCWTFSTIQALESASAIKYGILNILSEQELVDCDNLKHGGKDNGCNGGLMDNAFTWISKNNGICSELDYPYVSGITKTANKCNNSGCSNVKNTDIIDFVDIEINSDIAMMTALAIGPVAVAIEADQKSFQFYSSGIFTAACGTKLDHGVGLVGYTNDYWILRNSWGTSWGSNGYMLLGKGINPDTGNSYNNGQGQCGVLLQGSYPIL